MLHVSFIELPKATDTLLAIITYRRMSSLSTEREHIFVTMRKLYWQHSITVPFMSSLLGDITKKQAKVGWPV